MKVCIERVQRSHVAEFEILMQIKQVCHRSYRPALQRPNLTRMTQHIAAEHNHSLYIPNIYHFS